MDKLVFEFIDTGAKYEYYFCDDYKATIISKLSQKSQGVNCEGSDE